MAHSRWSRRRTDDPQRKEKVMRRFCTTVVVVALLAGVAGISTPSRAETGQVAVVVTTAEFTTGARAERMVCKGAYFELVARKLRSRPPSSRTIANRAPGFGLASA